METNGELHAQINQLLVRIAVMEERHVNDARALEKQSVEYERRLGELNHAHQQTAERNADFVSREAWETRNKEVDKALDVRTNELDSRIFQRNKEVDARLMILDTWRARMIGIGVGAGLAGGGIGAFIARLIGP